jgi:putative photosynthetic complex assembly protein 2
MQYALPAFFALFVWWFSTGLVIFLDNLPRRTFAFSMAGAVLVAGFSLAGLAASARLPNLAGAYEAFFFALMAWGFQEISFYTGFITGPRKHACVAGCHGAKHFGHALQATLWHEMLIVASFGVVAWLTWGAPNQVGLWTFAVLWWMHESARLNVFFGVKNLSEEFLPAHLAYLKSFFRSAPMNLFFPLSITVSMVAATLLFTWAAGAQSAFTRAGDVLVGTMMALAIAEHWFLVVPLPAAKLWHWGLASRGKNFAPRRPGLACDVPQES